jgi:hypothetical protein
MIMQRNNDLRSSIFLIELPSLLFVALTQFYFRSWSAFISFLCACLFVQYSSLSDRVPVAKNKKKKKAKQRCCCTCSVCLPRLRKAIVVSNVFNALAYLVYICVIFISTDASFEGSSLPPVKTRLSLALKNRKIASAMTEVRLSLSFLFVVVTFCGALVIVLWSVLFVPVALLLLCGTRYFVGSKGEPEYKKVLAFIVLFNLSIETKSIWW